MVSLALSALLALSIRLSTSALYGGIAEVALDPAGLGDPSSAGLGQSSASSASSTTSKALGETLPADAYLSSELSPNEKYFAFQTSGGWGNQRLILRWAMRAANAMDRVMLVPMIAPHSMMWWGYTNLSISDMVPASRVLDLEAMALGTVRGVKEIIGHVADLKTSPKSQLRSVPWKIYYKPQTKTITDSSTGKKSVVNNWLSENAIKFHWRKRSEAVVFWQKGSMWLCCSGGDRMTPFIMFSRELKSQALKVEQALFGQSAYHAVHVRRGQGHTRLDRRTAQHYIDLQMVPGNIMGDASLYIATDESNPAWFKSIVDFVEKGGNRVFFWKDAAEASARVYGDSLEVYLNSFPPRMRGDVIGFIEQLLCARAARWTGSNGSTFSFAIQGMRSFATLREIEWKDLIAKDPVLGKIYDGKGEGAEGNSEELPHPGGEAPAFSQSE